MLEYATALKTLNRKLEFLVNYLNGLPVGKKRHKFGTAYLDWLNEKDEKGLKDHLKLLNDLYSQDCPFRRDLFSGIKLPEEFQGSCSVPSSCSHPLSASNTLIDIVCQLHIKAGKHATMFREESEKMRIAEQRKCNVDDARKKQKLDQPFIDTHGFQEVSSEQWREWRNLPAITVARQQYDEMFWQGKQKDLPKACFKENAKLPEWPSFKTTVVDKYIDAITKTAPLWRALVQNIHDRWPKNLRVISHKYVRDFFSNAISQNTQDLAAKHRVLDTITFGDTNMDIFYGNGSWRLRRGWVPAPSKGLREWIASRHRNTHVVREEYTSQVRVHNQSPTLTTAW